MNKGVNEMAPDNCSENDLIESTMVVCRGYFRSCASGEVMFYLRTDERWGSKQSYKGKTFPAEGIPYTRVSSVVGAWIV